MTQEAYGQAYQKEFSRTVRVLCSRGASIHHAEDVAQTAWLQGWQKMHQLRDESMLARWINAIAVNYYHRGSRYEARYQTLPDLCGRVGIDLAPLDAQKILNFCGPADRMLFELQLGGLTNQEIAEKHGVSATAIRIRFSRARKAIRERVDERTAALRESMASRDCAA